MIFNGIDLSDYMHTTSKRPLMPSPVVATSTVPGRDGFEVQSVRLESFSVPVECDISPESPLNVKDARIEVDELKRRIASMLFTRELKPLYFDTDPTRYCMAIVSDVSDIERFVYVDKCTITFLCEPYFYSAGKEIALIGTKDIYIGGTLPTRPVFNITSAGSISSIKLTNVVTGEFVQVNASFTAGVKLMIDMQARRATINGADAAVTVTSDFFELSPGMNRLALTSGAAAIAYKEVWL